MQNIKELLKERCVDIVEQLIVNVMNNKGTFSDAVASTRKGVEALGVEILEQYYSAVDMKYNESRDRRRILVKNKTKTRTLITAMGNITLKRQLYLDKVDKRYFFAVDELLKLEKYSRIEQGYQAELLKNATLTSYGKSAEVLGQKVSRQTVFNISKKLKNYDISNSKPKRKDIGDLYLEADEDHIHMNSGSPGEVKLVYVHEGRRVLSKSRKELINPKYFASFEDDPDTIWNDVALYISERYNVKGKIYISGDGAQWIKCGLNVFPKSIYRLDKFHLCKSIMESSYGSMKFRKHVFRAIRSKDKLEITNLYATAFRAAEKRTHKNAIATTMFYINNNIDNIDLDNSCCSAESHVSHVLSARMSSRPMGWSKAGAERMAKLRAYLFNKGNFSDLIMYGKQEDSSRKLIYGEYSMRVNAKEYLDSNDEPWARVVGLTGLTDTISRELRTATSCSLTISN